VACGPRRFRIFTYLALPGIGTGPFRCRKLVGKFDLVWNARDG